MRWLRSEEMEYISLIVNEDAAKDCIQKLGDLGVMEFKDLNSEFTPFQRRYVDYIKRCDELERKLRYMEGELQKFNIKIESPGTIDNFVKGTGIRSVGKDLSIRAMDHMENVLKEKEQELLQLNSMHEKLTSEYNERKELQEILGKTGEFFAIDLPQMSSRTNSRISRQGSSRFSIGGGGMNRGMSPLLKEDEDGFPLDDNGIRFKNITGVVPSEDRLRFERMIFRATRGNYYSRFSEISEPITDPTTGTKREKQAFVVFFQSDFIESKLRKICEAFHARLYTIPPADDRQAISNLMQSNSVELNQSNHILRKNRESCVILCRELAHSLQSWIWTVKQEKSTYHTLNMFKADVSGMLRGEGWVIKSALEDVRSEVIKAHCSADKSMPSLVDLVPKPWPVPPTYFHVNKFTSAYQEFVDTYGVPRYREVNPAVFTAITFPFLFGVMYGDIGHGTCLFIAGLYLVLTEKRLEQGGVGEMMESLYNGRYMLLMMGAFAMYAGLVYNDVFALSLNLFGSKYTYDPECLRLAREGGDSNEDCQAFVDESKTSLNYVYPFGLDPIWKTSTNELLFFNSFKMKLSVILGILQMFFGLLLKGLNCVNTRNFLDFFFEFIPQVIFTCSLFFYMIILIVMKWSINWDERQKLVTPTQNCTLGYGGLSDGCVPPPLINTLIDIVLKPGTVDNPMYMHQSSVQSVLLLLAFISIPLMLLVKPFALRAKHSKKKSTVDFVEESAVVDSHGHGEEFEFGEVFIHQAIETIEFVLGMVSNTASYLRLWALSLAHSELATVFWKKAMLSGIQQGNAFAVFIGFAVFAAITTGVLLLMDVLECFLHALRLHWVEFQNKFYKGDGYRFAPFCFRSLLKRNE